jgi:hypothetical protein
MHSGWLIAERRVRQRSLSYDVITVVSHITFPELYSILNHDVLVVTAASGAQFCALRKGRVGYESINFWPGQTTGMDLPIRPAGELFQTSDRSVGVVFIKCTVPEQNSDNNTVESLTRLMLPRLDMPRDPRRASRTEALKEAVCERYYSINRQQNLW